MHHDFLISHINRYLTQALNPEEEKNLRASFIEKPLSKRDFLLRAGEYSDKNSFIVKGCFRTYILDPNGKEHNLQFAIEEGWVGDLGSFHKKEPTEMNIEALENSIVLQIDREKLYQLYSHFPVIDRFFRVLLENAYIALQKRLTRSLSFTAEARYLDFITRYPHLINRISDSKIASFLGMTPEFLSKIRKNLSK